MNGSRFTMEFEATGNAEARITAIAGSLSRVVSAAESMNKELEGGSKKLDDVGRSSHGTFMLEMSEKLAEASSKFSEVAEDLLDTGVEFAHKMLETASEFEDIRSSLQFSFQDGWEAMYDKTFKESQHLAFTFKQSSDLVANLGKTGVNVFGSINGEMEKFRSKTGEQIGALDVLQDTITGTGLKFADAGRVMRGVHEAMAGNFREFKMGLAMPPKLIDEMKQKMAIAGPDMQKRFEAIIGVLGQFYGGAGKLREMNFSYQIQQITDKFELLQEKIAGDGGLKLVTAGLKAFQEALQRLLDDKEAIGALSDAFRMIEASLGWVGRVAGHMIDLGRELLHVAPWLAQVGVLMLGAAIAGGLLGSVLLGVAGSATAVAAIIMAIAPEALLVGLASMAALLPVMLGMVAAVGVLGLMFKVGADVITNNWGGAGLTLEKIKVSVQALSELFTSFDGTTATMTEDTAQRLQKSGMREWVMDVMQLVYNASVAWEVFSDRLSDISDDDGPALLDMLQEFERALGINQTSLGDNANSIDSFADSAKDAAEGLIDLTKNVMTFVTDSVRGLEKLYHYAKSMQDYLYLDFKGGSEESDKYFAMKKEDDDKADLAAALEGATGDKGGADSSDVMRRKHDQAIKEIADNPEAWQDYANNSGESAEDIYAGLSGDEKYAAEHGHTSRGMRRKAAKVGSSSTEAVMAADKDFLAGADNTNPGYNTEARQAVVDQQNGNVSEHDKEVLAANRDTNKYLEAMLRELERQHGLEITMDGEVVARAVKKASHGADGNEG